VRQTHVAHHHGPPGRVDVADHPAAGLDTKLVDGRKRIPVRCDNRQEIVGGSMQGQRDPVRVEQARDPIDDALRHEVDGSETTEAARGRIAADQQLLGAPAQAALANRRQRERGEPRPGRQRIVRFGRCPGKDQRDARASRGGQRNRQPVTARRIASRYGHKRFCNRELIEKDPRQRGSLRSCRRHTPLMLGVFDDVCPTLEHAADLAGNHRDCRIEMGRACRGVRYVRELVEGGASRRHDMSDRAGHLMHEHCR
jgi:hypothetical protein